MTEFETKCYGMSTEDNIRTQYMNKLTDLITFLPEYATIIKSALITIQKEDKRTTE